MKAGEIRVWDPLVRALHWSLVLLCGAAWLSAEHAGGAHELLGIAVGAIGGLRLLWGFVGSRHARFADFVRPPSVVLAYLVDLLRRWAPPHVGHNPAGAVSIVGLLAATLLVAGSGWLLSHGPLAGTHNAEEMHEAAAALLGVLVAIHLAGVVLSSWAGRENLVRAMFTGRKRER